MSPLADRRGSWYRATGDGGGDRSLGGEWRRRRPEVIAVAGDTDGRRDAGGGEMPTAEGGGDLGHACSPTREPSVAQNSK